MCRIAGIIQQNQPLAITQSRVQEMCNLLQHGGPDDEGIYIEAESNLVLGNRRLALLDLSPAGHMPMIYNSRYVITYNGELYNHNLLREELKTLGHFFQNHTDTEVILAAFAQWSSQSFVRLKGMFAFALWDKLEKEMFLVRDPSGIKPLYYSIQQGSLVFASETRAFKVSGFNYSSHPAWPVMLMAYGHLPEPVTTLSQVAPLKKGCFLHYRHSTAQFQLQSFSHYSYSNRIHDIPTAQQEVARLLTAAVQGQMLADAPVGVFLSGGLDSAIIAALAAKTSPAALKTLSIYFEDAQFSEKKYQDLIIAQLHCKHQQYLLKEENFLHTFPKVLDAMDLPSCDGVNTWFISKYAKQQGLKAVLSGIGGDELFGGYPSFSRIGIAAQIQKMPGIFLQSGKSSQFRKFNRLSYLALDGIKGTYLFLRGLSTVHEIARQLNMDEKEVWNILNDTPMLPDIGKLDPKNQASWMELNLYMQNQLLRDSDTMGMAHGLEIRVPFLDHDFVQLVLAIHASVKYQGTTPKTLLINSFKHLLPQPIWDRPKMGFSFPFKNWLAKSDYVQSNMMQANKATQVNYKKFAEGKLHWSQLMTLVILNNAGHA